MRVALLGSGRGSNAEAILRAKQNGQLGRADIVGIFCDNPRAPMLKLGPRFGVPAFYLDPGPFKTKFSPEQECVWANTLLSHKVDLVVLAGFMRVIKAPLLDAFKNKIINIHPSLLPSFPGLNGIGQTWRAGVNEGGCTVHVLCAADSWAIKSKGYDRWIPTPGDVDNFRDDLIALATRTDDAYDWIILADDPTIRLMNDHIGDNEALFYRLLPLTN
ncbi:MAG: hypothetical protein EBU50_01070, partial [Opitutae bacterium]|nr:hypothetical protein [Opitutae bacterium]